MAEKILRHSLMGVHSEKDEYTNQRNDAKLAKKLNTNKMMYSI